jgi:hypothetical protein
MLSLNLVGVLKCRTQIWKRATKESFHQSLVEIGSVVYMFKKENCAQKQQIIIAWLGMGKLAKVIKTNLGDQYN